MPEQLPGFILAGLFNNSIVVTDEDSKQLIPKKQTPPLNKEATSAKQKKYLGNYDKKIVVLVNDENNTYLSDENLNFLTGVLNACKLNLAHIALMNFNTEAVDFNQLKKDMQPEYLILFGINSLQIQLPFTMPDYQVQSYSNSMILTAPALDVLNIADAKAKDEKTKLWKSLKKMFNIEK